MSAVQEIQSAIDKLTTQRDAATSGEWRDNGGFITGAASQWVCGDVATVAISALIVTLHRTIDAQIALLSNTVKIRGPYVKRGLEAKWESAVERAGDLALARAINGPTS